MNKNDFILVGIAAVLILLLCFVPNYNLYDYLKEIRLKSINQNKKDEGVLVVCKTCKGTGETEQDVNLLMAKATYSIWHNSHSRNCEACKKFPDGNPCSVDGKKYEEIMNKYKEIGPKIEKAACPDCMGCGSYKQYKGYRFGREKL